MTESDDLSGDANLKERRMEIVTILQLYSRMKNVYVEAELEVIEITANDIITESPCQTGGGGDNEGEIAF